MSAPTQVTGLDHVNIRTYDVPHYDVFQAAADHTLVFTRDPHGVLLELNFYSE